MSDAEIIKLIEQYKSLEKRRDIEESKPFGSQSEINYCESSMAAIEEEFRQRGEDIRTYL